MLLQASGKMYGLARGWQQLKLENKNMTKGPCLQDPFLNSLRKEKVPVSIYLVNGIKLQGVIESFDQFVVLLKNTVNQMVYKHAISTIVPARNVSSSFEHGNNNYHHNNHGNHHSNGNKGMNNINKVNHSDDYRGGDKD